MKKKNIEKLEELAGDYLQYRYHMYCIDERPEDLLFYQGACSMIEAIGGDWKRIYDGNDTNEEKSNITNYSHYVHFPSDARCETLDVDTWK